MANQKRPNRAKNTADTDIDEFNGYILAANLDKIQDMIETVDLNKTDKQGFTPLTTLLFRSSQLPYDEMSFDEQELILYYFINQGERVDFDQPDANGIYPVFAALLADYTVAADVLDIANLNVRGLQNKTIVMEIAAYGLLDIFQEVKELLGLSKNHSENNEESDDEESNNEENNNEENATFPLLNEKDDDGNTALHHAVLANRPFPTRMDQYHPGQVVQELCSLKADTTIENNKGETPLDLALKMKRYDMALLLRHCELSIRDNRRIIIKRGDAESVFFINLKDTVDQVKRAFLMEEHSNFHFFFPRFRIQDKRIMEEDRTFEDYGIRDDDVIELVPILRSGFTKKGGKQNRKTRKQRKQRKN